MSVFQDKLFSTTTLPIPDSRDAGDVEGIYNKLQYAVDINDLGPLFYSAERLRKIAERLARDVPVTTLASEFPVPPSVALDLYQLALYDVVLFVDDDGGEEAMLQDRMHQQQELLFIVDVLDRVANWFQTNAWIVRGGDAKLTGCDEQQLLGKVLMERVVRPMVKRPRELGSLDKPVLAIVLTNGELERWKDLPDAVHGVRECDRCISLQFVLVGDSSAQDFFLHTIKDGDPVDVMLAFEVEAALYTSRGGSLTPFMWLLKVLLSSLDPLYKTSDDH